MSIKLIGIAPCYNELEKGNLDRFLNNIKNVVDGLVLLDDASTDGSYERMLQETPHVLKNKKNMFLYEQYNTNLLLEEALRVYPDLTHILTLNIDSTFSPACYKEGQALIHKACKEFSPRFDMFYMRNINLWRSKAWWRCDGLWLFEEAERVYIREKGLDLLHKTKKGLHKGKTTASYDSSFCITKAKGYADALSIHWGFSSREKIADKVKYYLSLEPRDVPCPHAFRATNVYKLIEEYDLKVRPVQLDWFDKGLVAEVLKDSRKPRAVSYKEVISPFSWQKALCYQAHFDAIYGEQYDSSIGLMDGVIHPNGHK